MRAGYAEVIIEYYQARYWMLQQRQASEGSR